VADLGLPHAVYGAQDKLAAAEALLAALGIGWDDWPPSATTGPTCRCCARRLRLCAGQRPCRGAAVATTSPPPPAATARRASSATCC
jgi:hypothetical protein